MEQRVVSAALALDRWLDRLDQRWSAPPPLAGVIDPEPVATGVVPLDAVLDGGVQRGEVTVVLADLVAQAGALALSAATSTEAPCLVASPEPIEVLTARLLASQAEVAAVAVADGAMSEAEWETVAAAVGMMSASALSVSDVGSLTALARVVSSADVDLVVVVDAERYGPPSDVVAALGRLSRTAGVAVLAALADPGGELSGGGGRMVQMHSFRLGGAATLVHAPPGSFPTAAQATVSLVAGCVR
ncbi:DnaB-like helicase C-terminal domain-containing protein [Rhabdothermincola salaria]|uniref:DnaB-like helicase C-terminal domain-containing protein n=1 Tax=Rhabdothermincola salaria TaxID=2903142 RepID=UPI001E5BBF87|nr:DnaB-like helicase C-terminal domain-containing protein [Rhabdothermincola salaria]MCD9625248.1 hypothetical protein [Rhabdothermincola salaria]